MQFVESKIDIDGNRIEWYANPATRELIARYSATETAPGAWEVSNNDNTVIYENYTSFDAKRLELMAQQQEADSWENRREAALVFGDLGLRDVVPIINAYLFACYPPRLKPVATDVLMSWLPNYDFAGVTSAVVETQRSGHISCTCHHISCTCHHISHGSCLIHGKILQVVLCGNSIILFDDTTCGYNPPVLLNICIERVLMELKAD